jgi:predicted ArsR family transcriptional regulator
MLTINENNLLLNGDIVATLPNTSARQVLLRALLESLSNRDGVFLALSHLGEARTADIAHLVGIDRSNAGRVLDSLLLEGMVKVVNDCNKAGTVGRPSRVWATV